MTQEERYNQVLMDRFNRSGSGVQDFSGPLAPGVGREALESAVKQQAAQPIKKEVSVEGSGLQNLGEKMGGQVASNSAQQGNALGTAGGAMMMSGEPTLMAAGLGLTVLGAGEANKRAEQEKQRQAYNDRIAERQKMMQQIAQMRIE